MVDSDPLILWNNNSATLPILAKLPKCVLSTPPTSVPSELSFSMTSHGIFCHRPSVRPGTVDNVFLHSIEIPLIILYICTEGGGGVEELGMKQCY